MSLTTGVYGAAGHSSVDVKDDDGSRAGTVRDDAGSLGGYLNLVHTSSGLWADIVAQGTRHSMKASSDNNDFRARGWGWLGSLETGLPFSITDNLMRIRVARCTVARLMAVMGLAGVLRGKKVRTTVSRKTVAAGDRVNRQFVAERPDQLWVADFTYVSTWQGFVYSGVHH